MTDIRLYGSGELLPTDARRARKAVSRIQSQSQVRLSRIEAQVDETIRKADGYTAASASASADVVRLARLHQELEQVAPGALSTGPPGGLLRPSWQGDPRVRVVVLGRS